MSGSEKKYEKRKTNTQIWISHVIKQGSYIHSPQQKELFSWKKVNQWAVYCQFLMAHKMLS